MAEKAFNIEEFGLSPEAERSAKNYRAIYENISLSDEARKAAVKLALEVIKEDLKSQKELEESDEEKV